MAYIGRTEIGLERTGCTVYIQNDPRAQVMYYIDCMCTVLTLDDHPAINRLRNFGNYYLSRQERDLLIDLGMMLNPQVLLDKCIFQSDALCPDLDNAFYELSAVRHQLVVTNNIMIGGRNRQVHKIMAFKMVWLRKYWTNPMKELMDMKQNEQTRATRSHCWETCTLL